MTQSPSEVPPIADWNRLLDSRVAVVTGGGDGIGGAISRLFGQHGAIVEVAEIDADAAARTAEDITGKGGTAHANVVDVREPEQVERLAAEVLSRRGRVDVLVNNVGDFRPQARFPDSTWASREEMYRINLQHIFTVTHAFIASMVDQQRGAIVNVHSVEAMRGFPGDPVYAAMKAAAAHFTTSLAVQYGRFGIRVNGIGPDSTQTPQVNYEKIYEGQHDRWPLWAPVGRLGRPEDQARVALFLASDMSCFVTGHNIPVDGGTLAAGGWFFSPSAGRFVNRPIVS